MEVTIEDKEKWKFEKTKPVEAARMFPSAKVHAKRKTLSVFLLLVHNEERSATRKMSDDLAQNLTNFQDEFFSIREGFLFGGGASPPGTSGVSHIFATTAAAAAVLTVTVHRVGESLNRFAHDRFAHDRFTIHSGAQHPKAFKCVLVSKNLV